MPPLPPSQTVPAGSPGTADPPVAVLYLAGPMTGHPNYNRAAFFLAAARLAAKGYGVLNPANHPNGLTMRQYMAADCQMLLASQGLALLPGWNTSPGAKAEHALAQAIIIPILTVDEWLARSTRQM